jgi:hypothetical protein
MENDAPTYTPEELEELYQLIFLKPSKKDKVRGTLILFDLKAFKDSGTLRTWLDKELDKTPKYFTKKIDQIVGIKRVLFCSTAELPLFINERFSRIASWRLARGV